MGHSDKTVGSVLVYLGGRRSEGWEDIFLVGRTVGVTRNACEGLRETRQLGTKIHMECKVRKVDLRPRIR